MTDSTHSNQSSGGRSQNTGRFVGAFDSPVSKKKSGIKYTCITCRTTKPSARYYHRSLGLLAHLVANNVDFHFDTNAGHKNATFCKKCWSHLNRKYPHPLFLSTQQEDNTQAVAVGSSSTATPVRPTATMTIPGTPVPAATTITVTLTTPVSPVPNPLFITPARVTPVSVGGSLTYSTPTFASPVPISSVVSPTPARKLLFGTIEVDVEETVQPVLKDTLKFRAGVLQLLHKKCKLKMPFTSDLDAFIEHLDSCEQLATKTAVDLGLSATTWKQTESERRRRIIASIAVQKAAFLHPHINFVKDVVLSTTLGISDSSRKVLSSFNLSYSLDIAEQKMKAANERAYKELTERMASGTEVPVVKMDDFNRVSVHGTPGSANSGKFSTVHTQANLAVKFFPKGDSSKDEENGFVRRALPLPLLDKPHIDFSSLKTDKDKKTFVGAPFLSQAVTDVIVKETYGEKLITKDQSNNFRQPYCFDMSTSAAELKQFHVFDAMPNRMKSAEDLRSLMVSVKKFIEHYKDGAIWITGDFYVWRNVMKMLWAHSRTPLPTDHLYLRVVLCPWPDAMHIALNAQQALLQWNFNVFMPIWSAAFPDFAVTLVKLRPVRRMMLLTMMFLSWKKCRVQVLDWVKQQTDLPEFQRDIVESLVRLFDEELPLVLDAATAMASGDVMLYKEVLHRLLPLFIRYRKKNYVTIVLHILSAIQEMEAGGDPEIIAALYSQLPLASSEDLEVFHSLLRACIRPFDSHGRAVMTTLYLSSNKNLSARSFLAQVAKQKALDRRKRLPWTKYMNSFKLQPRQPVQTKRTQFYNAHLNVMAAALTTMFRKLIANSPNIIIQGEMMFTHSATGTKVRGYQVRYKVAPPSATTSIATTAEPPKKKRKKATKISQFTAANIGPETIVTFSERLLPLTLWGDKKVALNVHTRIDQFAAVETTRPRPPLRDITNQALNPVDVAQQNTKFYIKTSKLEKPPSSICSCPILDQTICPHLRRLITENEFIWWMYNMATPLKEDDFVRDEEDEEITEELW
ncbi:hypothetical protein DFS34DRAFT_670262 [Phlyctochytrium arcticum]|nr:hypothetical protein DFS34DRAFT_670262 [Phlyctochytrium arcticum]